jgi:hypothetical protein
MTDIFYKLNDQDKMYDFFMEMEPVMGKFPHDKYQDNYIREIRKMFRKLFKYDADKNIVNM